ncbi:tyrosine-sulfated glycopeptide receptor 1-like [Olea europaea var. sylvestris]|uniref:tyrosine-sulfated glycopeptide receptor 1-like n=1 Tax=Olea europaea var. sylvestris TaxID=158386 RepID=UPI000C1CEAE0|nr:tyrosine-sulfated glycopeptide receptor 1-like [Olea europaea var. sylvestris]
MTKQLGNSIAFSFSSLFHNLLFIILFGRPSSFIFPCQATCRKVDRDSLLAFSFGVSSSNPLNWSYSIDCCMWEGVSCDNNDRVIHLLLPSRGLVGSISPSVANLSHLSQFNLSQNRLSGPIPDGFFMALKRLVVVDLSENRLTGKLSDFDKLMSTVKTVNLSSNHFQGTIQYAFFQQAVNLKSFSVSNNSFSGPIPSSICEFSASIQHLDFSRNLFFGPISEGFGQCSNLQFLRAGFNNLSGDVPSDIYTVSSLQELYLSANTLYGPISGSLVNLINLRILSLYDNKLTGTIPQDIGRLSNLENLFLRKNLLNSTLPPSLANCARLVMLDLSFNFLEGELSAFDFSKFIQLRSIDLGNNLFSGRLPASLYSCNKLTAIRLAVNKLNGEISPGIMGLPSLSFLSLSNNSLNNITSAIQILSGCKNLRRLLLPLNFYDESLPDDDSLIRSDGFQNLQVLALGGCRLTGQIPMWLSKLNKLEVLDLSLNNITGSIPGWFGDLPNLFQLHLSRNLLSGQFPVELAGLRRLTTKRSTDQVDQSYLEFPIYIEPNNDYDLPYKKLSYLPPAIYIRSNSISGTIPTEIGQLKFITALDLSNNNFSGSIPDTISNLTNLEKLDLSGNHLSGQIPASFKNLYFLSSFNVAYNNLDGPIPVGGQFDSFPNSSFEGNPGLCGKFLPRSCSGQSETTLQKGTKRKIFNWLSFGIGYGISFILAVLAGLKFL